jgi:hypothetical protein
MSSANCPFSIFPRKESPETMRKKDRYVSINIPLDPSDPSSQKITHEYNKLYSTEVEDILEFFSTFDDIVNTLSLPEGLQRFRLIPALMGNDAQKKWLDVVNTNGKNQTQQELVDCIERFLLLYMEEDISLDIKEWMSEVKKPRNMSVQDFVQRLSHLNDLIEYTPVPNPISNPGLQTPKFTDAELSRIVRNACPAGWKKAQVHANLRHLSLAAQTRYYIGLDNTEPNELASHRNKPRESKRTNLRKNENQKIQPKNDKNTNRTQKFCEIHGKCNHSTNQCEVIRKQRDEYKTSASNKKDNNKEQPSKPNKYATRSTTRKKEQNNTITDTNKDDSSDTESEINHIEEIFELH